MFKSRLTCILACCPFFWPSFVRTDSTLVHTLRTDPGVRNVFIRLSFVVKHLAVRPVRTLYDFFLSPTSHSIPRVLFLQFPFQKA